MTRNKNILFGLVLFLLYVTKRRAEEHIGKLVDENATKWGRVDQYWDDNLNFDPQYLLGRKAQVYQDWAFEASEGVRRFKLKGVEFGNWLNEEERLHHFYSGMVSFNDLSKILKIKPNRIGFNQRLGIAFGARGRGGALAHYEQDDRFTINITKEKGAGSLAHEYGHFLDNAIGVRYFGPGRFPSGGGSTRKRTNNNLLTGSSKIKRLYEEIFDTLFWRENGDPTNYQLAQKKRSEYYNRREEVLARTFEQYVRIRLKELNITNHYLVKKNPSSTEPPTPLVKKIMPQLKELVDLAFK